MRKSKLRGLARLTRTRRVSKARVNHCFSVYFAPEHRWQLLLAAKLATDHDMTIGQLVRHLLIATLKSNRLMDKDGKSLVRGIGPSKKKPILGSSKLLKL